MKRILFFGALLLLTASVAMTVPAALFSWSKTTFDFGRITQGKPVTAEFSFTNKGEMPLVIKQARGSCGCTGVEYPKAAIMPGASGAIKATFNAAAIGAFNKTVTVESNAGESTTVLHFKGEVVNPVSSPQ